MCNHYEIISNFSAEHQQVLPKVIWEQPRRKLPISYNGTSHNHPQNGPLLFDDSYPI